MATTLKRDSTKGWRVLCDVHGELAAYRNFWAAKRDADQHREGCELVEFSVIQDNGELVGPLPSLTVNGLGNGRHNARGMVPNMQLRSVILNNAKFN